MIDISPLRDFDIVITLPKRVSDMTSVREQKVMRSFYAVFKEDERSRTGLCLYQTRSNSAWRVTSCSYADDKFLVASGCHRLRFKTQQEAEVWAKMFLAANADKMSW